MLGTDATFGDVALDCGQEPRQALIPIVPAAVALAVAGCVGVWVMHLRPAASPEIVGAPPAPAAEAAANPYGAIIVDPSFLAELKTPGPAPDVIALPRLEAFIPAPSAAIPLPRLDAFPPAAAVASAEPGTVPPSSAVASLPPDNPPLPPKRDVPEIADLAPLPPPRPPEFASPATPAAPERHWAERNARTAGPASPADNRGFLARLFGFGRQSGPAVASRTQDRRDAAASPDVRGASNTQFGFSRPIAGYDRFTAVYDISARTVYLPDGTRLEAHSGYGDKLDDPRYVNERMRGATPPSLYELRPREALFHGVQALRLTPIGDEPVFGRAGLLAHPYMLGPNGDSNGCVSVKDYDALLRAYQNGQVKKLAVVAKL
jgi:hypothetical protein